MMKTLSGLLVVASGVFLVGLAVLIMVKPRLAESFLRSFAGSARAHYSEQVLRLIAGGAMVLFAPMRSAPSRWECSSSTACPGSSLETREDR